MKFAYTLLAVTLLSPLPGTLAATPAAAQNKPPAKNSVQDLQQALQRVNSTESTPKPTVTYRFTYTVTESDGGRKLGVQHFSVVVDSSSNGRGQIKLGSRIPVPATGEGGQITYLDVGLNIGAFITVHASGDSLSTQIDQSSLIDSAAGGPSHPIIRQTSLNAGVALPFTKPVLLGSLDTPGSTRHLDVEVSMEMVP